MAKYKRAVSIGFLTRGYTRYVNLRNAWENINKKEREAIERYSHYRGNEVDIRDIAREDFEAWTKDVIKERSKLKQEILSVNPDISRRALAKEIRSQLIDPFTGYRAIISGTRAAAKEDIIIVNFADGLRWSGNSDLATRFETLARNLQENDPASFRILMIELPDLYLYYKDTGKSHVKRQETFDQTVANQQIIEFRKTLDKAEKILEEDGNLSKLNSSYEDSGEE